MVKKKYEISKEDIFNFLADSKIFPGSDRYDRHVKDFIFDCIGISEVEAPDDLVDSVVTQSVRFATKAIQHWRSFKRNVDQFRLQLMKPGRFLTNIITIPGPYVKEKPVPKTAISSRQGRMTKRGRPNKQFLAKKVAARKVAIAKVKAAANNDPDLVLATAKVMHKGTDLSYVLKKFIEDPSLVTSVKDQLKKKKLGHGIIFFFSYLYISISLLI